MLIMYAVIAVFNSLSVRGRSRYTAGIDKQFYLPYPKCTATFRTHYTSKFRRKLKYVAWAKCSEFHTKQVG